MYLNAQCLQQPTGSILYLIVGHQFFANNFPAYFLFQPTFFYCLQHETCFFEFFIFRPKENNVSKFQDHWRIVNVCFKKTVTKHSYILLLCFVTVFLKQSLQKKSSRYATSRYDNLPDVQFSIGSKKNQGSWICCRFYQHHTMTLHDIQFLQKTKSMYL